VITDPDSETAAPAKGGARSAVAVQHEKLPDAATAKTLKAAWGDYFDRLGRILS